MKLHSSFLRHISSSSDRSWLHRYRRHSTTSGTYQLVTAGEVLSILKTSTPIEKSLEPLLPFISPHIVSSVIINPPNPQLGLRFFVWASKYERFKTWDCNRFVVDMIVKERDTGGFEFYWEILREMRNLGVCIAADAFKVLIQAYEKIGKCIKAVEVFELMIEEFQVKPNVFTYNAVLNVMVRSGVSSLGLDVYSQMLKCNCLPNDVTFDILIDGLCKSREIEGAYKMFQEMTKSGFLPTALTYTIVISGLCRVEKVDEACRLFNKMIDSGIRPDSATYNALLDGFCKVGRVDEAFVFLRDFEKDGYVLGVQGYSCFINGLFQVKRHEEARALYRKMIEEGIVPDVVLYTIMIKEFFKLGKFDDALMLFGEMNDRGVRPDTYLYNALIKGFCDKGLLDRAKSLKLEISKNDNFPNTCTYTILICGMCRNGLVEEAEQLFKEMEEQGCYPSVVTFNALIDGLHKAGNLDKALHKFLEMGMVRTPSLCLRLSQGDSGSILKAYRTRKQLADTVVPDITTYNILINRYCKAGEIDSALKIFEQLQCQRISPDSVTYGTLINGLLKKGKEELVNGYATVLNGLLRVIKEKAAHGVLDLITKNGCELDISFYNTLMSWSCRRKNVSVAFSLWLKYLRGRVNRKAEAISVIEELFEKGDVENAVRGLLQMDIELKEFQLAPYTICLIGLCQAGRVDEALKMFLILEEYNIVVTPPSFVKLVDSLCKEGKLDHAVRVFHYTIDKDIVLKPKICSILIRALLRSDKVNEALKIFFILQEYDIVVFPSTCVRLMGSLCGKGNLYHAIRVFRYTVNEGFVLKPRICNTIIRALLESKDKANDALDLVEIMDSKGYDLESYLLQRTKSLLHGRWNSLEMEKVSPG